jgi:RND family efflux transporter MFP subunit
MYFETLDTAIQLQATGKDRGPGASEGRLFFMARDRLPLRACFFSLMVAFALTGCSKPRAEARTKEAAVRTVKTANVQKESMRRDAEVVGTLMAQDEVVVSAQSEGVVLKVLADLGDVVKEGQPLIELDAEKLRYNLDQQKATLSRALTKYGATSVESLPLEKDTPDVRRAGAELVQAKQARERALYLFKEQLIAQQVMDDAEALYQSKVASYDSALQNASNLKADIDVSSAMTNLAARQLRDTNIRAPFDAYVQKRMVTVGQLVSPQTAVMSLVRGGALKIVAEIPERMAPWIKQNQSAEFSVDAFADRKFSATISRISPSVNTQTRSFSFEAIAPNEQMLLKPGSFARVHVQTSLVEPALTIPFASVQFRFGVARAFVVDAGKVSAREVKLGDRHDDRIEVVEGLKQGEKIVVTDVDNLGDGMRVAVKEQKD